MSSASAFTPFNALRGYEIGREARKRGASRRLRRHSSRRCIPTSRSSSAARTPSSRETAISYGRRAGRLRQGQRCDRPTTAAASAARRSSLRAGICCLPTGTCGVRCRRFAAARNIARSARSGEQTASSRASARADAVVSEIVDLRRMGFRFILLSDDNFYPVTVEDLRLAERQGNTARIESLNEIRRERFELMEQLAKLPDDLVFYTQITMEAAEDPEFLKAMNKAKIRGALVGVESVTRRRAEGDLQGLQLRGRQARDAAEGVPEARRPHPRVVHLRPADRQGRHLRRDGRSGAAGSTSPLRSSSC